MTVIDLQHRCQISTLQNIYTAYYCMDFMQKKLDMWQVQPRESRPFTALRYTVWTEALFYVYWHSVLTFTTCSLTNNFDLRRTVNI